MSRQRPCRWNCGQRTNRRCGICLDCCNARDERDRRIDAGLEAYIPPDKRPGHRFYERKGKTSESKKAALEKATASRMAKFNGQMPNSGGLV